MAHFSKGNATCLAIAVLYFLSHVEPVFAQTAKPNPATVRTDRIELIDKSGRVRARLSTEADGSPVLSFFDKAGKPRLSCGVDDSLSYGYVNFFDGKGSPRIVLNDLMDDPRLFLTKKPSELVLSATVTGPRITATYGKVSCVSGCLGLMPFIDLNGLSGNTSFLRLAPTPILSLAASKSSAKLEITSDGPVISLTDSDGSPRAVIGVCETSNKQTGEKIISPASSIKLFNAESNLQWSAP